MVGGVNYHISNFNDGTADKLGELFNKNNSDKANNENKPRFHNYHFVYNSIFKQLGIDNSLNILEIGLGTNDINVASNMGENGTPGASIKALKEFLPNANLYGADVDKNILFQEERIKTCYVDQMNEKSFVNKSLHLPESCGRPAHSAGRWARPSQS